MKSPPFTVDAMVARMAKFCAYRERSHAGARHYPREAAMTTLLLSW